MLDSIVTRPYEIDRKEYLAAMWSLGLGRRLVISGILFLVVTVAEFFLLGVAVGAAFAAIAFTVLAAMVGLRYLWIKKQLYDSKNAGSFAMRTASFTDSTIHVSSVTGTETKTPWSSVIHAERRGAFSLLYVSEAQFIVVPDQAFQSNEERKEFLALVARYTVWKGKAPALDPGS